MKPIDKLIELNILCWSSILIGLENGWINREDVRNYAIALLSQKNNEESDEDIILFLTNEYTNYELKEVVSDYVYKLYPHNNKEIYGIAMKKWRLAYLLLIDEEINSSDKKIEMLQSVYADFDYPDDMRSCSIYAQDNEDPLLVMKNVIEKLKNELLRDNVD